MLKLSAFLKSRSMTRPALCSYAKHSRSTCARGCMSVLQKSPSLAALSSQVIEQPGIGLYLFGGCQSYHIFYCTFGNDMLP